VWWLVLGTPLIREDGRGAVYTAITLLIVASPCALIIATPTATLSAIARGARSGVLFKGGQSIERLSRLRAIAFDKTGTLTIGRPRVHDVQPIGWSNATDLLEVAAGLEMESTHPIATAIREAAEEHGVAPAVMDMPTFTAGRGMQGLHNGIEARLGSLVFTDALVPACLKAAVGQSLSKVQKRGEIGVVVAWNAQAGVIVLSDQIRPGAPELVERLHAQGIRPVCMLTGDNRATAEHVARTLGIDRWHAELLPEDKVRVVQELKAGVVAAARPGGVGVIGDGVNDAPALAAADVSIGIGSIGSDAALETADIVLLSDDLGAVPWALGLARRTRRTIARNLVFSLSAIAVMAVATLVGSLTGHEFPLWMGVLGHEGGTLLVVANSLLLLAHRGVPPGSVEQPMRTGSSGEMMTAADSPASQHRPAGATATTL
jgi:Cd2+/Zn2+-exporting ATPase